MSRKALFYSSRTSATILGLILLCLPFHAEAARLVPVSSMDELRAAIEKARPGDTIELAPGSYGGARLRVDVSGSQHDPIIIRAKERGTVNFETLLWLSGDYLQAIGLDFRGEAYFKSLGTGNRLSHCSFDDLQQPLWVDIIAGSRDVEISYNSFTNKTINRTMDWGQVMQLHVVNDSERYHVHHNLFKDIPKGMASNRYETIQLAAPKTTDPLGGKAHVVIEDNLFIRCSGEPEIISVKSNGNVFRRNTFRECRGSLVLRRGDENHVYQNSFFGDGEPGSGGVRFQGENQLIVGNYFHGLGDFGVKLNLGTKDNLYLPVENALIAFNSFVDCARAIVIGKVHPLFDTGLPPRWVQVIGNAFQATPAYSIAEADPVFVHYEEGGAAIQWLWRDNAGHGAAIGESVLVHLADAPVLVVEEGGLANPTANMPTTIMNLYATPAYEDLSGNERLPQTSLGAIERGEMGLRLPLTEADVGPLATPAQ